MNEKKFVRFYESLQYSYSNSFHFVVPSYFIDDFRDWAINDNYQNYYVCRMTSDYLIFLNSDNLITNNPNNVRVFYLDNDYHYFVDDIYLSGYGLYNDLINLMNSNCFNIFNSDYSYNSNFSFFANVNTSNYDDLVNSKSPSEYIITMLYLFIPLLLFIFGIKVVRKGLFK